MAHLSAMREGLRKRWVPSGLGRSWFFFTSCCSSAWLRSALNRKFTDQCQGESRHNGSCSSQLKKEIGAADACTIADRHCPYVCVVLQHVQSVDELESSRVTGRSSTTT